MDGFTLLASGFGAIEGPVVDDDGSLYFSDVFNGGVRKLTPDGTIEVVVPRRRYVGGIVVHRDGGIVVSGRDLSHVRAGASETILAKTDLPVTEHVVGGFNDICADPEGRLFAGFVLRDAAGEIVDGQLAMVTARGSAEVIHRGIGMPNGTATSPDGRWLYHADTQAKAIAVVDLAPAAGAPALTRHIATETVPGGPDGMAVDEEGGIWAAFHEGGCIARFAPDGTLDRRVAVPANDPLSVCFVGPELAQLVVVTHDNTEQPERGGSVLRTEVGVRGLPVPKAAL
jgi:gluconolactonase